MNNQILPQERYEAVIRTETAPHPWLHRSTRELLLAHDDALRAEIERLRKLLKATLGCIHPNPLTHRHLVDEIRAEVYPNAAALYPYIPRRPTMNDQNAKTCALYPYIPRRPMMNDQNAKTWNDEYDGWMVYRIDEDSVAHGYVIARKPSEALAVYEDQCNRDLRYGLSFEVLGMRLVRPGVEITVRWDGADPWLQDDPRLEVRDRDDGSTTVKATAATWADRYGRCGGAPVTLCFSEW